jgi:biofilm PGA synthesis N-glycosyltransferase PgaC
MNRHPSPPDPEVATKAPMTKPSLTYVLITPARNESKYIEKTLESVVRQTVLPLKWVIVNDGSTDATSNVVRPWLAEHPWIELINLPVREERHFAAKVNAFNTGQEKVREVRYAIIGNLDGDVSLDADHFEFLLNRFEEDPRLGVAGTTFREESGYDSAVDSFEGEAHVAGQCQLFRRECFTQIGGYKPNKAGGIDWMAVTTARMMGWRTRSFREKSFFHHRTLGTAERGKLASSFSYGEKDYYLGGHPVWEIFRVAWRSTKRPYVLDGLALGAGYLWAFITREKRPVSRDLMRFHRGEQMQKLKTILRSMLKNRRIDSFKVSQSSEG